MLYLWLLPVVVAGSYAVATVICLLLTPLAGPRYYRFGLEPEELAEPRQLRELEDVITLAPEDS